MKPPRLPMMTIDFEATCLPESMRSMPIEVAVCDVAHGRLWEWLVDIPDGALWDPGSMDLHGLAPRDLIRYGLPADQVAASLEAAVAGYAVVSDAVGPDGFWLRQLYRLAGRGEPPFKLGSWWMLLERLRRRTGVAGAVEIDAAITLARRRFPREHRAGPDARRNAEVIRILAGWA